MSLNNSSVYSLAENDLFIPSFKAEHGFKHKYCAFDMVFATECMLEKAVRARTP